MNPNITIDFVLANPNKPWNYYNLSSNPNITMEFIKNNPYKSWDYHYISRNKHIMIEFIKNNINKKWDWFELSKNTFTKEKEIFNDNQYRRYMAAYKIQQWYKSIILSPHYKIGRKMINLKYTALFE